MHRVERTGLAFGPSAAVRIRVALILLTLAALPIAAHGQGREGQLEDLLEQLAVRAQVYERTALRFSCREEARVSKYTSEETVKKAAIDFHDYLLEYEENTGLVPYRAILSHNGKATRRKQVEPDYPVPEPYGWHLLFTRERRDRFQFTLVGEDIRPPEFSYVIEFNTLLSDVDGVTIDQWEGTVWVDQDTLDIVRIEAIPSNQSETSEAAAAEYRQSFRVLGMGTKAKPMQRKLKVEFGIRREQLRFPSRVFSSERVLDSLGRNGRLKESVALTYDSYVFYGVDTEEEFEKLRDGS